MRYLKNVLIISLLLSTCYTFSQMGVNTPNPDSSSVLELNSIRRGFLLPRMTSFQRRSIQDPAHGLLVFDKEDKMLYYFDTTYPTPSYGWASLNPWLFYDDQSDKNLGTGLFMRDIYTHSSIRSIGIGTTSPNVNNAFTIANNATIGQTNTQAPDNGLLVEGEIKSNDKISVTNSVTAGDTVRATLLEGFGTIPLGGIIMWSGSVGNIPDGWELCDGGTVNGMTIPDLQGRFIVGAGTKKHITREQNGSYSQGSNHTYSIGSAGGADDVKMTVNEMPSHNHGISDPGHEHSVTDRYSNGSESVHDITTQDKAATDGWNEDNRTTTKVKTGITINNTGGNVAHENRPPYFVLAYIIRVK